MNVAGNPICDDSQKNETFPQIKQSIHFMHDSRDVFLILKLIIKKNVKINNIHQKNHNLTA